MRDIVQYTVLHYNSMLMKMGEEEEGNGVWSSTLRKKFPDMREWEFNRWGAGYALDDTSPILQYRVCTLSNIDMHLILKAR